MESGSEFIAKAPARARYVLRRASRRPRRALRQFVDDFPHRSEHARQWVIAGRKPRVHYLQIGKTGTSAVEDALAGHTLNGRYWILIHGHETYLPDIPEGEQFAFTVRDPINRFVSGFYSRQRMGQPRYNKPWSPPEQAAFERFPTAKALAEAIYDDDHARAAMQGIYHVKSSYWDWFIDEEYFRSRLNDLLMVGRQESLTEFFNHFTQVLQLDLSLPRERIHKNPASSDRTLSDKAVENLRRWYEPDYRFLALLDELNVYPTTT